MSRLKVDTDQESLRITGACFFIETKRRSKSFEWTWNKTYQKYCAFVILPKWKLCTCTEMLWTSKRVWRCQIWIGLMILSAKTTNYLLFIHQSIFWGQNFLKGIQKIYYILHCIEMLSYKQASKICWIYLLQIKYYYWKLVYSLSKKGLLAINITILKWICSYH